MIRQDIHWIYRVILFFFIAGLTACSTGEDDPVGPVDEVEKGYFIGVTRTANLNRASLVDKLGVEGAESYLSLLPDKAIRAEAIRYWSKDPEGKPLEVSGIITYPTDGQYKGIVLAQHFTIAADKESPSAVMATIESALALFGYVVVAPDYIGFGATADLPQTYIHAATTGQVGCDMFLAAREYFSTTSHPLGKEVYAVGYSQGGYAALAFQQMAEQQYAGKIAIQQVFAGGGPYVPESMFDSFMEQDLVENPATILLTIVGADYADGLGLDYTKILQEPVLSNYREWCVSKKYTLGQINRLLPSYRLSDWLHPDFFTPETNSEIKKLKASLAANNLTTWHPSAPILFAHGTKDETVPFSNTQMAYDTFRKAGCNVELFTSELDHTGAAIPFYILVMQRLM